VVKAVSVPDHLAELLRSPAWMHAAESIFYRQTVLAAAGRCDWRAYAVEVSALPPAEQVLTMLGQVAGRPRRRIEKDAARGAITLPGRQLYPAMRSNSLPSMSAKVVQLDPAPWTSRSR
jgi:hypothetical protein